MIAVPRLDEAPANSTRRGPTVQSIDTNVQSRMNAANELVRQCQAATWRFGAPAAARLRSMAILNASSSSLAAKGRVDQSGIDARF